MHGHAHCMPEGRHEREAHSASFEVDRQRMAGTGINDETLHPFRKFQRGECSAKPDGGRSVCTTMLENYKAVADLVALALVLMAVCSIAIKLARS
jgi:hypothetical protein